MKKLLILLMLVSSVCGATQFGPFDPGAVRKTDYTTDQVLKMDTDGSNAAAIVTFPGDIAGVNASFTGVVEAGGVELMKNDGSNAAATVTFPGDIAGVNASFTGVVEAGGVELMKNDGSNAAATVTLNDIEAENATINDRLLLKDMDVEDIIRQLEGFNAKRWGVRITKAEADPSVRSEYLYDAVGMAPASMNFASSTFDYGDWMPFIDAINRPVMLNPDGTVAYELDPNNHELKLDGTASDISSTAHDMNAMAEFRRLWLRVYEDATHQYIIFSNVRYDQHYQAFAFTNEAGRVQDRMYYAMFEGSNVSSKLRSIAAGSVMVSQTAATEISYAEANGAGWHINYKSQRDFITYLLALISKSTDSQAVFGQGNSDSADYIAPGALKDKGRFWGAGATNQAVKVFYIENYWGNYWKRLSGLLYNDAAKILIKATPPYSLTGVGYTNTDVTPTGISGQLIRAGTLTDAGFLPTTVGGSSPIYFADGLWYSTPAAGTFHVALVGGRSGFVFKCGSWACHLFNSGSADTTFGASLSFLK